MDWLDFIILGLATWRAAAFVTLEDGPFDIFKRLRESAGITHHEGGGIARVPDNISAKFLSCLWCVSIWAGAMLYGIHLLTPVLSWILAISCLAVIIERIRGDER